MFSFYERVKSWEDRFYALLSSTLAKELVEITLDRKMAGLMSCHFFILSNYIDGVICRRQNQARIVESYVCRIPMSQ